MPGWHISTAPRYLLVHCSPVSETASRQHLRSAASHQLTVPPRCQTTYGGRAFAVAAPLTWNSLPKRLRDPCFSSAVSGRLLKTFFSQSTGVSSTLIRGFGYDALYKSTFYITLHYI